MSNQVKTLTAFERLKLLLDYVGLPAQVLPVSSKNQVEQLEVSFTGYDNKPDKATNIVAQLMYINDFNRAGGAGVTEKDEFNLLQFYVGLNLQVSPEKLPEIITLILRFNPQLLIGAFEINSDNVVYYRYNYVSKERDINGAVIVEILEMIEFIIKVFGYHFGALAEGKQTLEKSLEQARKDLAALTGQK
jgi:hypothetical protein